MEILCYTSAILSQPCAGGNHLRQQRRKTTDGNRQRQESFWSNCLWTPKIDLCENRVTLRGRPAAEERAFMSFNVITRTEPGPTNRDATIYVLQHGPDAWAEVWPALGFNCIRWQVKRGGETLDLLYDDPNLFGEGRP